MAQLYARIFLQILDSSIAEDFTMRHVFEDFLKLAYEGQHGVVDMTRQALSRRLNLPLEVLNDAISKLEAPDPNSRDPDNGGRRIAKLDDHRDWGWKILNWHKFDEIKRRADVADRVAKHRKKTKPVLEDGAQKQAEAIYEIYPKKVGKPEALRAIKAAVKKFGFETVERLTKNYVGVRNGDLTSIPPTPHPSTFFNQERFNDDPQTWKPNETHQPNNQQRVDRNKGTLNEGRASAYATKPKPA